MYGWIWARLPGRWPVKAVLAALLLVGVVALLWFAVFPAVEQRLPYNDVTVNEPAPSTPAP
ncbi:MAG: hypothetical protein QOG49_744 [Frankiaceae bacterium]|nr:hypothetical protein [Frankiaceae bacterium]